MVMGCKVQEVNTQECLLLAFWNLPNTYDFIHFFKLYWKEMCSYPPKYISKWPLSNRFELHKPTYMWIVFNQYVLYYKYFSMIFKNIFCSLAYFKNTTTYNTYNKICVNWLIGKASGQQ